MPFVNNNKLIEIRNAAKQGNEKALMILQAMRKNGTTQLDIDRLVGDYYAIGKTEPQNLESQLETKIEPKKDILAEANKVNDVVKGGIGGESQPMGTPLEVVDLTQVLDEEMDGLLDETEIEDISFTDFLSNKSRDTNRMNKNADYFKAYDPVGRENYMNDKIGKYRDKFRNRLGNIERKYNDISKSMNYYMQQANDMLDDNVALDMNSVNGAYNDFTTDETAMSSFGRHWDELDNENISNTLKNLVNKYGKKNVIAALNTISSDNNSYKDFLNNQIDTEINRYSKSLEKLLK